MKRSTPDVDAMIREVLSQEDAEVWDSLVSGPTVHETVVSIFRGRNRWLTYLAVFATLVFMALAIYSLMHYLGTDDLARKLDWGGATLLSLLAIGGFKLWYWMEMQRTALSREIKRLELQVAHLSAALTGSKREPAG